MWHACRRISSPISADCVMQREAPWHEVAAVSRVHPWALKDRPNLTQGVLHGRGSFSTGNWCAKTLQLLT